MVKALVAKEKKEGQSKGSVIIKKTPAAKKSKRNREPVDLQERDQPGETSGKAASSTQQDARNHDEDMDNLFDQIKKARAAKAKQTIKEDSSIPVGSADDLFGTEKKRKGRRETQDGLTVYSEEELGINRGGDTDLCPFDCKCCV